MEFLGKRLEAPIFNDILEVNAENSRVLGTYLGNYYKGRPAVVEHPFGKGKVIYYGAAFSRENVKALLEYTGVISPYENIIALPEECELSVRTKGEKAFLFVLNYSKTPANIVLKQPMLDLKEGAEAKGERSLAAYEVRVFECLKSSIRETGL